MELRKAQRTKSKIRIGVAAPSGAGKTYTSLLLAYGLCGDWSKIALIDTENGSGDLYEHLGAYNVITLPAPYSPANYERAIAVCETGGMEVIVVDSTSHEWEYILAEHGKMAGNSFTNWSKFTPIHDKFIQSMLQSRCHVICTIRSKTEYTLTDRNGKQVPQKFGMKPIMRDGFDFEMTIYFEMDINHMATCTKDRTELFKVENAFTPTIETGKQIKQWCESGAEPVLTFADKLYQAIKGLETCMTVDELTAYKKSLEDSIAKSTDFYNAGMNRYNYLITPTT